MRPLSPPHAELRAALSGLLPEGAFFEYTERGLCARRSQLPREGFRIAERLLSGQPLWVFDFCTGPADLSDNVHDGKSFRAGYEGVPGPLGASIYRVDHHHPIPALARDSTTPLVRRWLLSLHERGRDDVLADVSRGRYLANHWDADILFAHHLAANAIERPYVDTAGAVLAAAALRNDHLEPAPPAFEPAASSAYYSVLGLERAITRGETSYRDAQVEWLPALAEWALSGRKQPRGALERRVAQWESEARGAEESVLQRIALWCKEGRLHTDHDGRVLVLSATERIDNACFFLYVRKEMPLAGPRIQLLTYPSGGDLVTYKIRSHGGLDLHPLFLALNEKFPQTGFGGRATAGGSRPTEPCTEGVVAVLRSTLGTVG
ncbi:hypothetical protein ACFL59_10625 [Planctomycetota bacterium]